MRRMLLLVAGIAFLVTAVFLVAKARGPAPVWSADTRAIVDLAFSPDGEMLAVISRRDAHSRDVRTSVYEARAGSMIEADLGDGRAIAWSQDGKKLAIAGWDRGLRVIATENWRSIQTSEIPYCYDGSLGFDPLGNVYCCNSYCSTNWDSANFGATVWWQDEGRLKEPVEIGRIAGDTAVSVATSEADGALRVAISYFGHDTTLYRVDVSGDNAPQAAPEFAVPGTANCDVRFSFGGKYLTALGNDRLTAFELTNAVPVECLSIEAPQEGDSFIRLRRLDLARKTNRLAAVLKERIEVRQLPDGGLLLAIPGSFAAVSIAPDGEQVAALSRKDPKLRVYHVNRTGGR